MTRLVVIAALALTSASPAPVTSDQWVAMLAAARPGSTIELGNRPVTTARYSFQPAANVTIRGGVFGPITLDHWANVTFDGATFRPTGLEVDRKRWFVLAYGVRNLRFKNLTMVGDRYENGKLGYSSFSVRDADNVTVSHSTFRDIGNFLAFTRSRNVQVTDCDFTNIREGVQLASVTDGLIARNRFGPYDPAPLDHPDGVQMFVARPITDESQAGGNVVIEDNLFEPGEHIAQGVWMREDRLWAVGRGFHDITIRRNVMVGTGWHGIGAPKPIRNLVIENNALFPKQGFDNWIYVNGGATVRNNRAGKMIATKDTVASGNVFTRGAASATATAAAIDGWTRRFRGR